MSAIPTREQLAVSGGQVGGNEQPLWMGQATVGGVRTLMTVSIDRELMWLRFPVGQLPAQADAFLTNSPVGRWWYSEKRRKGYWIKSTPEVAKFVRGLGAHVVQHVEPAPVPQPTKHEPVEIPAEPKSNGKVSTHVIGLPPGVRLNKAGRPMDAAGKFLSAEKLAAMQRPNSNGQTVAQVTEQYQVPAQSYRQVATKTLDPFVGREQLYTFVQQALDQNAQILALLNKLADQQQ